MTLLAMMALGFSSLMSYATMSTLGEEAGIYLFPILR